MKKRSTTPKGASGNPQAPAPFEVLKGVRVPSRETLTKFLVATGLHQKDASTISELFLKWCHQSGPEWTNSRWKELRMWYEQSLGGNPGKRPPWFKLNRHGEPKGPLHVIWKLEPERALLVLSINTLLVAERVTPKQLEKIQHGFGGNGYCYTNEVQQQVRCEFAKATPKGFRHMHFNPEIRLLDTVDLEGRATVPVKGHSVPTTPPKEWDGVSHEAYLAQLVRSQWQEMPLICAEFLWDLGHPDYIPIEVSGGNYRFDLNPLEGNPVGRAFVIQEEQIKPRFGVSYNATVQLLLKPLGDLWWRTLKTMSFSKEGSPGINQFAAQSCFMRQDLGCDWVMSQLSEGTELAGVDLTSATDLLSLDACIEVVNTVWFPNLRDNEDYQAHLQFFRRVSRAEFDLPKQLGGGRQRYQQGWPLGTYPSFALLSLTMMAVMRLALLNSGRQGSEQMNLGDDAILHGEAAAEMTRLLQLLGGEINESKTLTSRIASEFAGCVITAHKTCPKATKLTNISDDSFMTKAATIGNNSRILLKPRQRRMWDTFKYVPGIALGEPWSTDGYGEPLALRYQWYLECVEALEPEPDRPEEMDAAARQLRLSYLLGLTWEEAGYALPWPFLEDGYHPSFSSPVPSGDPRKWRLKGHSLLEILEERTTAPGFVSFQDWKGANAKGQVSQHLEDEPL